jgi:hypothetical protein
MMEEIVVMEKVKGSALAVERSSPKRYCILIKDEKEL